MWNTFCVVVVSTVLLNGCSGINRLTAITQEKASQEKLEEQAHRSYQLLKAHAQSLVGEFRETVERTYGEPSAVIPAPDGSGIVIYRDFFSWCSEKLYLYYAKTGAITRYEFVLPCKKNP